MYFFKPWNVVTLFLKIPPLDVNNFKHHHHHVLSGIFLTLSLTLSLSLSLSLSLHSSQSPIASVMSSRLHPMSVQRCIISFFIRNIFSPWWWLPTDIKIYVAIILFLNLRIISIECILFGILKSKRFGINK